MTPKSANWIRQQIKNSSIGEKSDFEEVLAEFEQLLSENAIMKEQLRWRLQDAEPAPEKLNSAHELIWKSTAGHNRISWNPYPSRLLYWIPVPPLVKP